MFRWFFFMKTPLVNFIQFWGVSPVTFDYWRIHEDTLFRAYPRISSGPGLLNDWVSLLVTKRHDESWHIHLALSETPRTTGWIRNLWQHIYGGGDIHYLRCSSTPTGAMTPSSISRCSTRRRTRQARQRNDRRKKDRTAGPMDGWMDGCGGFSGVLNSGYPQSSSNSNDGILP